MIKSANKVSANNLKDILDTLAPKGSPYKISALYIKKCRSYDRIYKKQHVSVSIIEKIYNKNKFYLLEKEKH